MIGGEVFMGLSSVHDTCPLRAAVRLALVVALLIHVSLSSSPPAAAEAQPRESDRTECPEATQLRDRELTVAKKWFPSQKSGSTPTPFVQVGGCVRQQAGWWSYEVCPGKWIRQLHEEGGRIQSEYFLGFGPRALDDDDQGNDILAYRDHTATMREQIARGGYLRPTTSAVVVEPRAHCRTTAAGVAPQRKQRTSPSDVVVDYPGGTMCEVTSAPRSSKIIYVCDAAKRQFVWNITETRPCNYLLFVVGRVACEMMTAATTTASPGEASNPAGRRADIRRYPSGAQRQGSKKSTQSPPASAQVTGSVVDAANALDDELAPGVQQRSRPDTEPTHTPEPAHPFQPPTGRAALEQPDDPSPSTDEEAADDGATQEVDESEATETTYNFEEHMIFAL